MATIEIPDEWVVVWNGFDSAFELLKRRLRYDEGRGVVYGSSRQDIYSAFRLVTDGPPWRDPCFRLWAAVRHQAANYGDLQEIMTGWRSDTFAKRGFSQLAPRAD